MPVLRKAMSCASRIVYAQGVKEEDMAKWFAAMKAAVDTILE